MHAYYEKNIMIDKLLKYKKNLIIPIFKSETEIKYQMTFLLFFQNTSTRIIGMIIFLHILLQKKLKKNFSLTKRITNQIKARKK